MHPGLLEDLVYYQQDPFALRLPREDKGSQGLLDLRLVVVVSYDVVCPEPFQCLFNPLLTFLNTLVFQQTFMKLALHRCVVKTVL